MLAGGPGFTSHACPGLITTFVKFGDVYIWDHLSVYFTRGTWKAKASGYFTLVTSQLQNFAAWKLKGYRNRRHGPFISCYVLLPLRFALSGAHMGSSFLCFGISRV